MNKTDNPGNRRDPMTDKANDKEVIDESKN